MGSASMKARDAPFDMIGYAYYVIPTNYLKNKPEQPAPVQEK